jgi:hypothetical protein
MLPESWSKHLPQTLAVADILEFAAHHLIVNPLVGPGV